MGQLELFDNYGKEKENENVAIKKKDLEDGSTLVYFSELWDIETGEQLPWTEVAENYKLVNYETRRIENEQITIGYFQRRYEDN